MKRGGSETKKRVVEVTNVGPRERKEFLYNLINVALIDHKRRPGYTVGKRKSQAINSTPPSVTTLLSVRLIQLVNNVFFS